VTLAQAGGGDPTKSGFFLNIHLKKNFIENSIRNIYLAEKVRLAGTDQSHEESKEESKDAAKKQRVLVDFSSPNIAKNMHVGHLRSTI
jgi:arginyl-tRNA synthetase